MKHGIKEKPVTKYDTIGSLKTKKKIFLKKVQNWASHSRVKIVRLPWKFPFLKILKIIVESSLIALSAGKFILKNTIFDPSDRWGI